MKRLAAALLLIGTLSMTQPASAWTQPKGPCAELERPTRQDSLNRRQWLSRRIIVCVFDRIMPSQTATAIEIAKRESGLDPYAANPYSAARGLFQHMLPYWDGRARAYLERRWFPNTWVVGPFSARANAICAARMVRANGWGAWSTS